jgi:hypothetical protein
MEFRCPLESEVRKQRVLQGGANFGFWTLLAKNRPISFEDNFD